MEPNRSIGEKVPLHGGVLEGKLGNGMKYYILPNQKPENKLELRLVVNAGSMQEDDLQQGLAHFCEHMAFNGTKNFEKNELVDFLQSAGVKFGAHLNAYTSFDETVYMLSLPTDREELVQKGFLVLEDWAQHIQFDPDEVDKERGVVLEELRLRLGAEKRMMDNYLPVLFKDSRYANRLPIGKEEVLKTFDHERIKSFYRDWYRPDLMAVVVVGNIEPPRAEAYIKEHFEHLQNPVVKKDRELYPVPDHDEIFVSVSSDSEATSNSLNMYFKVPGVSQIIGTVDEYKENLTYSLIFSMINERLNVLSEKKGAPASYAWVSRAELFGVRTKIALQAKAMVAGDQYSDALRMLYTEILRAKAHGFTELEFKRARDRSLKALENNMKEQDKTPSNRLSAGLVSHFLTGRPFTEPAWAFDFATLHYEQITLPQLLEYMQKLQLDKNAVVVITGTEDSKYAMPGEAEIRSMLHELNQKPIAAPQEEELPGQLMQRPLTKGFITFATSDPGTGCEQFELSNGITIQYKTTQLKNNQVLFSAISPGGTSLYSDEQFERVRFGLDAITEMGLGAYSNTQLGKILAGKNVRVRPSISTYEESLGGSTSPDDMELLFQMIHLYFNEPRRDSEAFDVFKARQKSLVGNLIANPSVAFNLKWLDYLYPDCSRNWRIPSDADWENTDYEAIHSMFRERFANPADFKFYFVGNIEESQFKEYCERYLGTLKAEKSLETYKDVACRPKKEPGQFILEKGTEPKSSVRIQYMGTADYSKEDALRLELLADVLSIKLTETLREEMSGVYGSGANGSMSSIPYERYGFTVSFPCGPENVEPLTEAARKLIAGLISDGPQEKDVQKAIEAKAKEIGEERQNNGYWLNYMEGADRLGVPLDKLILLETEVRAVTADQLRKTAETYLSGDPFIGILNPENH